MYFDDFIHRTKKEDIPAIVLLYGESENIMAEGSLFLKTAYLKRHLGADIVSFDCKSRSKSQAQADMPGGNSSEVSDDLVDVLAAAQTNGLFSNERLVVLKHAEKALGGRSEKAIEQLQYYFKNPNPNSHLVFLAAGLKKNAKIVDAVERLGWTVQCSDIPEWKIGGWLLSQATETGLTLSNVTAQLLIDKIGSDAAFLQRALEQLAIHIYPKKTPTESDVRDLPAPGIEPEIFAFLDAFGMRQTREAIHCLEQMREKIDSGVVRALYQRVREILKVAVEKSQGITQVQLVQKLRFHAFRIRQLWAQSLQFSVEELESALSDLVRLQAGIVTGRVSEKLTGIVLQKLIIKWGPKGRAE